MRYQLAIFDLDGTILNTLEDLYASTNFALKQFGYPPRTMEEVRRFVGNGIRKLVERAVPPGVPEDMVTAVYRRFMEHYSAHCSDHTRAYEGIPALLQTLRQAGVKTAISSNKSDSAVQRLRDQYFPGLFDAAAGEKTGVPKKPAPDSVEKLLKELCIRKEDAVYIGDSEVDIQTAKNAGLDGLIVSWGFRDRDDLKAMGAEEIFNTPEELLERLLSPGGRQEGSCRVGNHP